MAGVGDEIDAHAFEAPGFADLAEVDDDECAEVELAHRRDRDIEQPLDRHPFKPVRPARLAVAADTGDRVQDVGRTQAPREGNADPQRREQRLRRRIDRHDPVVVGHRQHGFGQRRQEQTDGFRVAKGVIPNHAGLFLQVGFKNAQISWSIR